MKAQAARMVRAVRALRSRRRWLPDNKVRLLENGEEFFPAVFDAIRNAGSEALLASRVNWPQAWAALRALPPATLLAAAGFAAASHALYATYDLIGRHETGHGLRRRAVLAVGFTSYAFNLNLGALVGGLAFLYRLYARLGRPRMSRRASWH